MTSLTASTLSRLTDVLQEVVTTKPKKLEIVKEEEEGEKEMSMYDYTPVQCRLCDSRYAAPTNSRKCKRKTAKFSRNSRSRRRFQLPLRPLQSRAGASGPPSVPRR